MFDVSYSLSTCATQQLSSSKIKKNEFLSPTLSTSAIIELAEYFTDRFEGRTQVSAEKPTVVTCFDTRYYQSL